MMRRTILWSIACLLIAACGSAAPGVRQVQRLYETGDYAGAERAADRELARTPRDATLWRLKIDAAIRSGDSERGVDLYMQWHRLRRHYDQPLLRSMAVSTLWQALGAANAELRRQALQAIERLDIEALYRDVATLLSDQDELVAATAAIVLAAEQESARARGMALWRSADPRVRAMVIAGLGRVLGTRVHGDVLAALDDASPHVRHAAAVVLGRAPSSGDTARLLQMAREDADGRVRAAALAALARSRSENAFEAARAALVDPYLGARLAALALLARWPEKSRELVLEQARSSDLYVALRAAVAVRKAGGEVPMQTLQWALKHPTWTIRVAALNALSDATSDKVRLALISDSLQDERVEVRLAAARVLLRSGKQGRAADIFAAALDAPRDELRIQAAIDLVRMHDDRGRAALVRLARSPSATTRRQVAGAHRYMDNPTLPLVTALGDSAAEVRIEAAATMLWLLNRR
jgi:HEAT repeat protein